MAKKETIVYDVLVCDYCDERVKIPEAETIKTSPMEAPGFYVNVKRVLPDTGNTTLGHVEPVFVCTKECLINYVQYKLGNLLRGQKV